MPIKLHRWETREGRESGRKKPYAQAPPPRKTARVTHHFPHETVCANTEQRPVHQPQSRAQMSGMVGIVERGGFADKRMLACYLAGEERDGQFIRVYTSPDENFYAFRVLEGKIVKEPDGEGDNGMHFDFRNYPDPVYHRTFRTPHDPDYKERTFEHHCRRLAGNRITDMVGQHVRQEEIKRYRNEIEEFLKLSGDLFRKYGQF